MEGAGRGNESACTLSLSLSDARVVVFSSAVVSRHRVEYEEREFEGFVISATRPLEIHSRRVENAPNDNNKVKHTINLKVFII
jgi:hypothetical protein